MCHRIVARRRWPKALMFQLPGDTNVTGDEAYRSLGNKQSFAHMRKLFDNLAALDKKIADRWKRRTRDKDKHVLSAADVDYIHDDVIKSGRTSDITEKQGRRSLCSPMRVAAITVGMEALLPIT